MAKKGRVEMTSMSSRFKEVLLFISKRKRMKKEGPLFNGELLDRNREDVFSVMCGMGMSR
jgi:hypothetical protein